MVLDESGICRLCGSEEKVGFDSKNPQDAKGSVDLPFGLGQDSKQEQPTLPFGINHPPSNSAESTPARSTEDENSTLPFGLEHSPDNENSQSDPVEADLQKETLPFGIEDSPPEKLAFFQKVCPQYQTAGSLFASQFQQDQIENSHYRVSALIQKEVHYSPPPWA